MMSGANEDAAEGHDREKPGEGEEEHVAVGEERPRRRHRRHRSRHREDNDDASIRRSRSRGREHDDRPDRRRRTRGGEQSSVEILERTDVPYGRELPPQVDGASEMYGHPQVDGRPQPHGPPQMRAQPGVHRPPAEDRDINTRSRHKEPSAQPPRHPKMKSYDGGGLMSLVKAIGINLVQEQQRRREEAKNPNGGRKDGDKRPKPRGRDEERRRRRPRSRGRSPVRPRTPRGQGAEGHSQSGEYRPGSRARSEEHPPGTHDPALEAEHRQAEEMEHHREPPMDPATEAEYRQAADMETEYAHGQAADMAESRAQSPHDDVSPLSTVGENPFDNEHSATDPMVSTISSMPPSTIGEPQSRIRGHTSRSTANDSSAAGTPSRRASVAGSIHSHPDDTSRSGRGQRGRPVIEATDSESDVSGHESDRSLTSTRASIRSTSASSIAPSSGARRGNSGRGGGGGRGRGNRPRGGAGSNDNVGGEYYNLHESYDDEYHPPPGGFFDARNLGNDYWAYSEPGRPFSYLPFEPASHANQGPHNQGFNQGGPVLVQLPGTAIWMTMAQYQSYLQHPQRFTQFASTAPRENQGRADPHQSGWFGGSHHPGAKGGEDGRSGEYQKANKGPSRHQARRDHHSSGFSNFETSEPSDTDSSSDDNPSTREARKAHSNRGGKHKSKSQAESKAKTKSSSNTGSSSRRDPPKPSERRSPRPYARHGSRAPKSREHHSDTTSSSPTRSDGENDRYASNDGYTYFGRTGFDKRAYSSTPRSSARDDGCDSFEYSNTDRRSKSKPNPKPKSKSDSKPKPKARAESKPKPKPKARRRRSYSDFSDPEDYARGKKEEYPSPPAIPEKPIDYYAVIGLTKTATAAE